MQQSQSVCNINDAEYHLTFGSIAETDNATVDFALSFTLANLDLYFA